MSKRVLVVGATGFVGPALVDEFSRAGFQVVCGVRNLEKSKQELSEFNVELLQVDLDHDIEPDVWLERLKQVKVDGLVNNVGIANSFGGQSIDNVNFKAPVALFEAVRKYNKMRKGCDSGTEGIRVIQISTTGVDWPDCEDFPYTSSKKKADEALLLMKDLDRVIIRPNIVYEPMRGHLILEQIARIPVIFYIYGGFIQPIFCRELAIGIVRIMVHKMNDCPEVIRASGPEQLTWEMIFFLSRRAMGGRHAIFIPVPLIFAQWFTRCVQLLPDKILHRLGILSKMTPETIFMMTRGCTSELSKWSTVTSLRSVKLYNVYKAYKKGSISYSDYLDKLREEFTANHNDLIQ